MKFSTAAGWTLAAFLAPAAAQEHLRAGTNTMGEVSSCNEATDLTSCAQTQDATGNPCEWCVAGAIPSECMSTEQANQLPAGVFECSIPSLWNEPEGHYLHARPHQWHVQEGNDDICDASSKSIAGYMDIKGSEYDANGEDKHLFFWMFEKRPSSQDQDGSIPFVVWLTGGPGCSSTLALLTENGPCSVNDDGQSTTRNPHSWTEAAHVLWLDQPAGVGFSYGQETDTNEAMVSEDVYFFLQAFFQTYPEYQSSPLYIVGESYAGHYVPSIAHRIYQGNQQAKTGTITLNYAGLAIGNGLTSPELQYPAYPEMVWNNSHHIKVVDEATYAAMKAAVPRCVQLIHQCNQGDSFIDNFACQSAFLVCNTALTSPYQMTGKNPYDITKECEVPPLCYDFSAVETFLNSPKTKQALNVDPKHSHAWEECNFGINMKFHTDWMKDFSGYVGDLLNAGYPALIYVGDVDFICNYIGNEHWTHELEWDGKEAFQTADLHDYKTTGKARTAQGLTYLQVFDAGHMVPSDQPENALEMIRRFTSGGIF